MRTSACLVTCAALSCATGAFAQTVQPNRSLVQASVPAPQTASAFPDGARIAYVDLDRVAFLSSEGKAAAAKLDAFRSKKTADVSERSKQVDTLQQNLSQSATLLNDDARTRLQRELERAQIDFQRFAQDAQAEVQDAQQQIQISFTRRLFPVIGEVAKEKNLWAVFSVGEGGLLWANPVLDLSEEVAKRLDGTALQKR